jgi:hypothetical protein
MLRSSKQPYGASLGTAESEIGQHQDFYFNDQNWAIRHLVVETGCGAGRRYKIITSKPK